MFVSGQPHRRRIGAYKAKGTVGHARRDESTGHKHGCKQTWEYIQSKLWRGISSLQLPFEANENLAEGIANKKWSMLGDWEESEAINDVLTLPEKQGDFFCTEKNANDEFKDDASRSDA